MWDKVLKKMGHFAIYMVLCFFWIWALHSTGRSRKWVVRTAVLLTVLYAISDEIHQHFTPGRSPRVFDVFIDTLGALTAARFEFKRGEWEDTLAETDHASGDSPRSN